jgi:hypothetical protein
MMRSVLAVIAGIAALTAASFAIEAAVDPLLMHAFPQALPNRAALSYNLPASILLFAYTGLCIVAGGYVTAWIARRAPIWHAVAMGLVQEALTVWAMAALGDVAPRRNWIVTLIVTIPLAACGGILRAKQSEKRGAAGGHAQESIP